MALITRCRRPFETAPQAPSTAMLLASVALPVKTTSSGYAAPMAAATETRAASTAFLATRPIACVDDGLPYAVSRNSPMVRRTSG